MMEWVGKVSLALLFTSILIRSYSEVGKNALEQKLTTNQDSHAKTKTFLDLG